MPIEVRELHIRVVVQDTREATFEPPGGFAVAGDTSQDHDNWIDVTAVNMGGHKPGGGAAGDDAPVEDVLFAYAQVYAGSGSARAGGGRDVLLGGAGADHTDAAGNRGCLLVEVDDVHLKAQAVDGFDL